MKNLIAATISLILVSGCSDNKELLSKVKTLEENYESLKSTVEINEIVASLSGNKVAFLKPGDSGYSVISFDLGKLTISIDNVTQYAGGVRVTFKIGNTLSSNISGLSADFEYGQVDEKGLPKENVIKKSVKFQDELKGGSWNKTTVVLEGLELKDLGYIRIKNMAHTGVKLTVR
jgi:hypothetical protein